MVVLDDKEMGKIRRVIRRTEGDAQFIAFHKMLKEVEGRNNQIKLLPRDRLEFASKLTATIETATKNHRRHNRSTVFCYYTRGYKKKHSLPHYMYMRSGGFFYYADNGLNGEKRQALILRQFRWRSSAWSGWRFPALLIY